MFLKSVCICLAALALAGCNTVDGLSGLSTSAPTPRPKAVLVGDFVFASEVITIDRGFTARLDRKIGSYPTFERKQRTMERVNDEIVANIVATLRQGGLAAQPGNEETLAASADALVLTGRLRAPDDRKPANDKDSQIGFGAGRSGVIADMSVSRVSGSSRRSVRTFVADAPSGKPAPASAKTAAAYNAAVNEALAALKAAPEKLSADVEAPARRLGRAVGEKLLAYAKEQGWLDQPDAAVAVADEKPARVPPPKPAPPTT